MLGMINSQTNGATTSRRRRWIAATLAAAALATTGTLTAGATSANAAPAATDQAAPTALYCKKVVANDIRVFKSPEGSSIWGTWSTGTVFWTDRKDGRYQRYHTNVYLYDAWVTSDPRYVQPC